ncbi:MAG: pilus assembly protein TadG-related protein [Chloroflexota bacterium]
MQRNTTMNSNRHRHERGQVLVIVAVAMVAIVAMVGLVVDGGFAWGKQRDTQNAADAAAEAGAIVMAQRLAGVVPTKTDADVEIAVLLAGSENAVDPPDAYYTDIAGNLLDDLGAIVTDRADAAKVGDDTIPANAAGIEAIGSQSFPTFLVRVIGFDQLTVTAPATAVAGYVTDVCSAEAGCDVIPVTVPLTVLGCDGQNDPEPVFPTEPWVVTTMPITVPLCKNGPGNVGWLDWTPTAGGTSELEDSIRFPDNDSMTIPDWFYITATGNINSSQIEDALNERWGGQVALIPQFDGTCNTQPGGPFLNNCPAPNVGGTGSNQWYHLPQFAAFQFCGGTPNWCDGSGGAPAYAKGAYITGNDAATCDTGNGGTSCLAGRFVNFLGGPYTVGPGSGTTAPTSLIGVQLLK